MKKIYSIIVLAFVSLNCLFAVAPYVDQAAVNNWQWPIETWFDGYAPAEPYTRNTALAYSAPVGFAPASVNFDDAWAGISGTGYPLANVLKNSAQNSGAADFTGAYKVYYDNSNIYILLQYTDNDITGNEAVEIDISPKVRIDAAVIGAHPLAWYTRNMEFGAYVASFTRTTYANAFIITHNGAGVGSLNNYASTTTALTSGLKINDRGATSGAGIVKQIITIGFNTLQGSAFQTFNTTIWKTVNSIDNISGISFDINVVDTDTNDPGGKATSAIYGWNSTSVNCFFSTLYAGYLKINDTPTAVNSVSKNSKIFGKVTPTEISFTENADATIFNMLGEQVTNLKNVNKLDMSNLNKGVYIVRANNQILKFER